MLPGASVEFENGNLGIVAVNPDTICGIVASAVVNGSFELNKHYVVYSLKEAETLGVLPTVDNYNFHKTIKEFYQEAGDGQELWIYGAAKTEDLDTLLENSRTLLTAANRRISNVFVKYTPSVAETTTEFGLRTGFAQTIANAQDIAEDFTKINVNPVTIFLEAYNFTGVAQDLVGFSATTYNRVGVLIGDTETRTGTTNAKGAALGVLAGRITKKQLHEKISKVELGALKPLEFSIVDTKAIEYNVTPLHDKGFITFTTHIGKTGYYFTSDRLACTVEDDYHFLANRQVIDKAYKLAMATLTNYVESDFNLTNDGKISPIDAKTIEAEIERVIAQEMTAKGNLSFDQSKSNDRGVKATVDLNEKIAITSTIKGEIKVKPKGYSSYLKFNLGYNINN